MDKNLILSKRKRQQEELIAVHDTVANIRDINRKTADKMARIARKQRKEILTNVQEHNIAKILTPGEAYGFWGLCSVLPLALVACLSALTSVAIGGTLGAACFCAMSLIGGAYVSHLCWDLTEALAMHFYEHHVAPKRIERLDTDIAILEKSICAA